MKLPRRDARRPSILSQPLCAGFAGCRNPRPRRRPLQGALVATASAVAFFARLVFPGQSPGLNWRARLRAPRRRAVRAPSGGVPSRGSPFARPPAVSLHAVRLRAPRRFAVRAPPGGVLRAVRLRAAQLCAVCLCRFRRRAFARPSARASTGAGRFPGRGGFQRQSYSPLPLRWTLESPLRYRVVTAGSGVLVFDGFRAGLSKAADRPLFLL